MKKCVPEGQAKKPARQPPGGRKSATGDLKKFAKDVFEASLHLTPAGLLAIGLSETAKDKKKKKKGK